MTSEWILATGGAGYIGSHVTAELLAAGYHVVVLDNFENSEPGVLDRINSLGHGRALLLRGDVRHFRTVECVLRQFKISAVIHLAGKKSVGESVADPLLYYRDNLDGALTLFHAMRATGVNRLVFSSSATVYGIPERLPIDETASTGPTSPYGRTKLMIEEIIDDMVAAHSEISAVSLRYFNPVGAHRSGLLGEEPRGIPNNLFPYVAQTATGQRRAVQVFGNDYATSDGTGLRDYIHVVDLARGHIAAIDHLLDTDEATGRHRRINLGTGRGYTVLEVIAAFSRACGHDIPFEIVSRRPGDVAASLADPSRARELFGWQAECGLEEMCRDHWAFQSRRTTDRVRPLRAPEGVVLRRAVDGDRVAAHVPSFA